MKETKEVDKRFEPDTRFQAADWAIRAEELPSIGRAPLMQTASVILIAVVLIIGLLVGVHQ